MLWPPTIKLYQALSPCYGISLRFSSLLHSCNFAPVCNHNVNSWYAGYLIRDLPPRGLDPQVENNWYKASDLRARCWTCSLCCHLQSSHVTHMLLSYGKKSHGGFSEFIIVCCPRAMEILGPSQRSLGSSGKSEGRAWTPPLSTIICYTLTIKTSV